MSPGRRCRRPRRPPQNSIRPGRLALQKTYAETAKIVFWHLLEPANMPEKFGRQSSILSLATVLQHERVILRSGGDTVCELPWIFSNGLRHHPHAVSPTSNGQFWAQLHNNRQIYTLFSIDNIKIGGENGDLAVMPFE